MGPKVQIAKTAATNAESHLPAAGDGPPLALSRRRYPKLLEMLSNLPPIRFEIEPDSEQVTANTMDPLA
jgi:hypothetical protein